MESKTEIENLAPPHRELVRKMLDGDRRALARLMTLVEARPPEIYAVMAAVTAHLRGAPRLGVTGPPGAGKSTLIDRLIGCWRSRGQTVGAVAVDPSSPFSGGAVLGDRIRMQDHALDQGVFIRSLGSRGSHGGISRATMEMGCLLDAFGMDQIMIETVGVGQTELDIMGIADTTVVVLVPEAGDTVQTLKAGLMEIGNIFVINKADRDGAHRIAAEIRSMIELQPSRDGWQIPVLMTVARDNSGVAELADMIEQHRCFCRQNPQAEAFRKNYLQRWLAELLLAEIAARIKNTDHPLAAELFKKVGDGKIDPYSAAARILADPQALAAILKLET